MFLGSWKRLQADDYLVIFMIFPYTFFVVSLYLVGIYGSGVVRPEDVHLIDPASIPNRIIGAKLGTFSDVFLNLTDWICKGCMLIMYGRLTTHLWQHTAVKLVAVYVVVSFFIMEILFFTTWCRPFSHYWLVPNTLIPGQEQCVTYQKHYIVGAVFNISSDLIILALITPVLLKVRLPLKKKIILMGIFSLGIFTIITTILNKYYTLKDPYSDSWTLWYLREPSTAVLTTNLSQLWPLVQRFLEATGFASTVKSSGANSYPQRSQRSRGARSGHVELTDLESEKTGEELVSKPRPALRIWQDIDLEMDEQLIAEKTGTKQGVYSNVSSSVKDGR
jgi:hypothetical protein